MTRLMFPRKLLHTNETKSSASYTETHTLTVSQLINKTPWQQDIPSPWILLLETHPKRGEEDI